MVHLSILLLLSCYTALATQVNWISVHDDSFGDVNNWSFSENEDFFTPGLIFVVDLDVQITLYTDLLPNIQEIRLGGGSSSPSLKISASLSVENFVWNSGSLEIDTKLFNIHSTLDLASHSPKELLKGTLLSFGFVRVFHSCILTLKHDSALSVRHVYNDDNKVLISPSSGIFEITKPAGESEPQVEFFVPIELEINSHLKIGVTAHLVGNVVVKEGAVLEFNHDSEINSEIELNGENSELKVDGCTVQFKSKSYYSAVENDLLVYFNFRDPPSNGYFSDFFGNFYAKIIGDTHHNDDHVSMSGNNGHLLSSFRPAPTGPFTIYMEYEVRSSFNSWSTTSQTAQFGIDSSQESCSFVTGFRRDFIDYYYVWSIFRGFFVALLSSASFTQSIHGESDFVGSFHPLAYIVSDTQVMVMHLSGGHFYYNSHASSPIGSCQRTLPLDFGRLFNSNGVVISNHNGKLREYRVYDRALTTSSTLFSQSGEEGIAETITVPEFIGSGFVTLTEGSTISPIPAELDHIDYPGSTIFDSQFTCLGNTVVVITGNVVVNSGEDISVNCMIKLEGSMTIISGNVIFSKDSQFDGSLIIEEDGLVSFKDAVYTFTTDSTLEQCANCVATTENTVLNIDGLWKGESMLIFRKEFNLLENSRIETLTFALDFSGLYEYESEYFNFLNIVNLSILSGDIYFLLEPNEVVEFESFDVKGGSVFFINGDLKTSTFTISSGSTSCVAFTNTILNSFNTLSLQNGHLSFEYDDSLDLAFEVDLENSELTLKNFVNYNFDELKLIDSTRNGAGNLVAKSLSFANSEFAESGETICNENCQILDHSPNNNKISDLHKLTFNSGGQISSGNARLEILDGQFILPLDLVFQLDSTLIVSTSSQTDFQILGTLTIKEEGALVIEDPFESEGTFIVNGKLELDSDTTIGGTLKVSDGGEAVFKGDSYTFNENSKLEVHHPNTLVLQEPIELTIEGTYKGIGSITHSHGKLTFTSGSKVDTGDFIVKTDNELNFNGAEFKSLNLLKIERGEVTFDYDDTFENIDIASIKLEEGSVSFTNGDLKANTFTINSESTASASFINTNLDSLSDFSSNNGIIEFHYEDDLTISTDFDLDNSVLELTNSDTIYSFIDVNLLSSTRKGNGNLMVQDLSFSNTTFAGNSQTKCTQSCTVFTSESNTIIVSDSHELLFDANGNIDSEFPVNFQINSASFILKKHNSISTNTEVTVSTSSQTDFQILDTLVIEEGGALVIEDLFEFEGTFIVNGKLELEKDNTIGGALKVSDGGEAILKGYSYTFNENSKLEVHPNTLVLQEPIELTIEGTYKGIGSITHSHGKLTFTSGSKVDTGDFIVKTDNELNFNGAEFKSLNLLKIERGEVTFDYDDTFENIDIASIKLQEGSVTFTNGDLKANTFTINSESTASASFINTNLDSLSDFTSNNGNIQFNYDDDLTISGDFDLDNSVLELTNSDTIYSFSDVNFLSSTRKGNGILMVQDLSFSNTTFAGNSQTKCTQSCTVFTSESNTIIVSVSHELLFDANGNIDSEFPVNFQINSASFILKKHNSISTNTEVTVSTSSQTDLQILDTLVIEEGGALVIQDLFEFEGTFIVNGKLELDSDNTIGGTLKVSDGGEAILKGDSYTFNENSKLEVHPNTLTLQEPIELTIEGTYKGIGSITHSHGKLTFTSGSKVDTGDFIVKTDNELNFNGAEFKSLNLLKIERGEVTFDYDDTFENIDIASIKLEEGSVSFTNGDLKANTFTINSESTASASFINTNLDCLSDFTSNNGNIQFNYDDDLTISGDFDLDNSVLELTNSDTIYSFSDVNLLSSTRKGNGNLMVLDLSFSNTTFAGNSQTKCTQSGTVFTSESNTIIVSDSHELLFDANGNIDSEFPVNFQINSASFILQKHNSISTNTEVTVSTSSQTDLQILDTLVIEEGGALVIEDLFEFEGTFIVNGKLELDSDNTIGGTLMVLDGGEAIFKGDSYTFNENSKLEVHPNTLVLQEPIELTIQGTYKGIGSITHSHGKLTFTFGSKVDTDDFIVKTDNELTFDGAEFKSLNLLKIERGEVTFDYDDTFENIDIASIKLEEGSVTFTNGDLKANTFTINSESTASASFTNTNLDSLSDFTSNNGNIQFNYDNDLTISTDFNFDNSVLELTNSDTIYSFIDVNFLSSTRKGNGILMVQDLSFSNTTFAGNSQTKCTQSCTVFTSESNTIIVSVSHELLFDANGNIDSEFPVNFQINSASFILKKHNSISTNTEVTVSTSSQTDLQILDTLVIEEGGALVIQDLFEFEGTFIVNGKLELDSDNTIGGTLKVSDGGEAILKGDSYTFNENSKLEVHPNTLILQEPIELTIQGTYKGIGSITHSHGKLTFTSGSKVDTGDFIVKTDNELNFNGAEFKSLNLLKIERGEVTFDYDDTF
ncbi:hypothetical protein P9112_001763 [Eukaryota sp. TZLM1-RC]